MHEFIYCFKQVKTLAFALSITDSIEIFIEPRLNLLYYNLRNHLNYVKLNCTFH